MLVRLVGGQDSYQGQRATFLLPSHVWQLNLLIHSVDILKIIQALALDK